MMSDFTANYQRIIEILNEEQFREFVLLYNKEYYAPCEATFVDGPYDGGIDIEIRKQRKVFKIQIQVTIQERGIEDKIISDVRKAAVNVEKFDYIDTLYFFVNHPISNTLQMTLRKQSEELGISLQIHDAKFLASRAGGFESLRSFLSKIIDAAFPKTESLGADIQIIYDAVAQQRGIKAIKEEIIRTFLLKVLYEKGEATITEISEELDKVFLNVVRRHYYETLVGKIKGIDIDVAPQTRPKKYYLLPEAKKSIESIQFSEKAKVLELNNKFAEVCSRYEISLDFEMVYSYVERLYDDNYNPHNVNANDGFAEHLGEFKSFLKSDNNIPQDIIDSLALEILEVFELNDFTGKQSASKLLINLFKDNQLEDYLSSKEREVLFDTPVLIQYICYLFKDLDDYDYPPYQYVRSLIKTIEDPKLSIVRFTLEGYLKEVAAHLSSAVLVGRFLEIPEIRSLGKSKNSFYNFYKVILEREDVGSIEDYVSDVLGIDYLPDTRLKLESVILRTLRERLQIIGVDERRRYEIDHWMDYKKEYDIALLNTSGEKKSAIARINDLNAILYLSYADINGDAYLVTWDTSFERAKKVLLEKHPNMEDWYLYSPQQLAGTLSLLNFKINPSYVTRNVLSLMEGSIASNIEVKSLVDAVSEFLQGSTDSQMKVARNLAKIHSALYEADVTSIENGDEKPIDDMLVDILEHTSHDEKKYEVFLEIMKTDGYIKDLVNILSEQISQLEQIEYNRDNLLKKVDDFLGEFELE